MRIHEEMIRHYGGGSGLRDEGMLDSALAQPKAAVGDTYLHANLFEMAAAYYFHLVQNHPFVDGNKRVGAACAIIFLAINNIEFSASEDQVVEMTLRVASSQAGKDQVADFLRQHST